ncbi:MAG: tetratricopeptide repeat protein, partial [Microcoleaceae cyanobacterium]
LIHQAIGDLYLGQQDYNAASMSYRKVVELAPNNAEAHYTLAMILKERNRTSEAKRILQTALELYQQQSNTEGVKKAQEALKSF